MTRLQARLNLPKVKTEQELRSILNQPISAPCPICGSAIFAIGHDGALRCIGCHEADAHDRRVTAFWVTAFVRQDGSVIAVHHDEDRGYRDSADLPALAGATLEAGGGGGGPLRIIGWEWK